jgi:hypothetical protein
VSRFAVASLSTLMALAAQWACNSPTAPLGPCETSSKTFSGIPPAFGAVVTNVDYEHGIAPGGSEVSNYLLELAMPPAPDPVIGVFVKRGTPIFDRSKAGALAAVTACAIGVGARVEIWHDDAIGTSSGTPPPNTWYYGTQVVIVR